MSDSSDGQSEYKVLVWDADETSTATFFRGPSAYVRASDHFSAARDQPESREAWFFRRAGKGWQLIALPKDEIVTPEQ
jgi:hypothetical protein